MDRGGNGFAFRCGRSMGFGSLARSDTVLMNSSPDGGIIEEASRTCDHPIKSRML